MARRVRSTGGYNYALVKVRRRLLIPRVSPLLANNSAYIRGERRITSFFTSTKLGCVFINRDRVRRASSFADQTNGGVARIGMNTLDNCPTPVISILLLSSNELGCSIHRLGSFLIGKHRISTRDCLTHRTASLVFEVARYESRERFSREVRTLKVGPRGLLPL